MYGARRPSGEVAGYHSETISSRAVTPAAQGSGREVSVSHKGVVPTGHGPVGLGRHGGCPGPASALPASAEAPMPPSSPAVLALIKLSWASALVVPGHASCLRGRELQGALEVMLGHAAEPLTLRVAGGRDP